MKMTDANECEYAYSVDRHSERNNKLKTTFKTNTLFSKLVLHSLSAAMLASSRTSIFILSYKHIIMTK